MGDSKKNIVVETFPNKDIRYYHVRLDVSKRQLEDILAICGVNKFPGNTKYWKEQYLLKVEKGKAFDWNEIEPKILEILG